VKNLDFKYYIIN